MTMKGQKEVYVGTLWDTDDKPLLELWVLGEALPGMQHLTRARGMRSQPGEEEEEVAYTKALWLQRGWCSG